jgi:hypothetical protein
MAVNLKPLTSVILINLRAKLSIKIDFMGIAT